MAADSVSAAGAAHIEAAISNPITTSRRRLIKGATLVVSGVFAPAIVSPRRAWAEQKGRGEKIKEKIAGKSLKEEVTPPEDLMREHGVLDRVLLVYEACLRKFSANEDFDPAILKDSAQIVRDFIEDYHEQSEERDLFPRFKNANKLTDLVDVLYQQHQAGRRVTDVVLDKAMNARKDGEDRRHVVGAIEAFIRMYRPHAAREDTELFPELKHVVSSHEYDAMAEDFEKQEQQKFGEDGFEKIVHHVADIERKIGIYDLAQFTPK
jgi:hemerythrin-like domain-containing protein